CAIVTVLPEPVTPFRVCHLSPRASPVESSPAARGWSPASGHGSTRSYVARPAGRSRGTWRISLELICAFSAILERAFEPGREGHPPPMLPPRHVAGRDE